MRRFMVAAKLSILALCACHAAGATPAAGGTGYKRIITVSALNDQRAPVRESLINELLSAVSEEYRQNVNVELKVVECLPYSGDLTLYPIDQAFHLQRLAAAGEIRIIFSNLTAHKSDLYLTSASGAEDRLAGSCHSYFGHLILYDVERRSLKQDRAGNPALTTAIKHEITHLFGVGHSDDIGSFMYTPSSLSFGEWTEEVIRQVLERKEKRWFPHA